MRHANEFWDHYGVYVQTEEQQPGDIIVFSNGIVPNHVGIVYDKENFIHAPGKDDSEVIISAIARSAMRKSQRLIGYKSPVIPVEHPSARYFQQPLGKIANTQYNSAD